MWNELKTLLLWLSPAVISVLISSTCLLMECE